MKIMLNINWKFAVTCGIVGIILLIIGVLLR